MKRESSIFVAGHRGMVGSALCRELKARGFENLIVRTRAELDLREATAVRHFFDTVRPEYVFLAAAKVGGIHANNTRPAEFLVENLKIECNVIESAHLSGVKKLLLLGSTAVYPKEGVQPFKESSLMSGPLEPTNEAYGIAKIAGIKLCQAFRKQYGCDFISAMPTNMYGPSDNYDLESSHVVPALIRKFHEAKVSGARQVSCWGTGIARREFLYSDDVAKALILLMEKYSEEQFINVGAGADLTIRELTAIVRDAVGFQGEIVWDSGKPDGTLRRLTDNSRLVALGWKAEVDLPTGVRLAYQDFLTKAERK